MSYAITLDSVFTEHETPAKHPERPDRIRAIAARLRSWTGFTQITIEPPQDIDTRWLGEVHSDRHLSVIEATRHRAYTQLDPDTHAGQDSYRVASLAAGSAVNLTARVLDGDFDGGFVLARPPGHHAERARPMGFCLFNNVAVAAVSALDRPEVERVAIVDFDVHHGNGTQEIFYDRSDVLYVSSHQHPLYPGTGRWEERGSGEGEGYTLNLPVPAGKGNRFFLALYDRFVVPALESYRPDLILVSAGFDGHHRDPLAGMNLDEEGFAALAQLLNECARALCAGRIVYVLEGGYDLDALAESVLQTIRVNAGDLKVSLNVLSSPDVDEYSRLASAHL